MLFVIYYLLFPRSQSGGTDADSFSRHGCGGVPTGGGTKQTPSAGDFDISGTGSFTHDGDPKTVTAKEGKTTGTVSVTYTGAGGAVSITAPSAAGTYTVTFDVTESAGWNSASGLSAGTLTITGIGPTTLIGITAEYTPATAIFTDTTLETLRAGLTVTAQYGDGSTAPVTGYTLSVEGDSLNGGSIDGDTLTEGENTVTVTYTEGTVTKTAAFTVTVDALTHEHNWSKIAETAATCVEADTETWECTASPPHFEIRAGTIDPTAHDWKNSYAVTTPATCTAAGIETDTCNRNAAHTRTRDTAIDPAAHNWNNSYAVTTPATCMAAGIETDTCSYNPAQHTRTRDTAIDPNAHNWNSAITPATCMAAGIETVACSYNPAQHTRTQIIPINPAAHDWNVTTTATPTAAGAETGVCRHNGSHTYSRGYVLAPMVFVPGGTFQLGKALGTVTGSNNPDVTLISNVTLSGFYIGKYEVTQKQYQTVMGMTIQQLQAMQSTFPDNFGRGDAYPVYFVTWYDAVVFCNKLSVLEGLTPAYRISNSTNPDDWGTAPTSWNANSPWNAAEIVEGSTGYRLPTEAQWEYAAKGGNPLAPGWVGYTYAGSDNANAVAWHDNNGGLNAKVVGTKDPNFLGLYDMSGNVLEWCWDWYGGYYTGEDKTDPTGASSGSNRVQRSGCFNTIRIEGITIVYRTSYYPTDRSPVTGFRLVRPDIQVSTVFSTVKIDMFDAYGDGWNGNSALRIVKNGTELAAGVKVQTTAANNTPSGQRSSNTYTLLVQTGDVVQLYWVSGQYQEDNSFIAYYADTPPNPAFTAGNNNSWSGTNALVYRLRGATGSNTLNNVASGALLGSFTVP